MSAGRTDGLTKTFLSGTAIGRFLIVAYHATVDNTVILGTTAVTKNFGVSVDVDEPTASPVDVRMDGIAPVFYGGTVVAGDPLTAGTGGRAVVATTAGARCIGYATMNGASGDIGAVNISPFTLALVP